MNLVRETLTTVLGFYVPEEIKIDGNPGIFYKEEDHDGDYIEYSGWDSREEHTWDINIWLSGSDANIRASIDGDEIDSATVDITKEQYLDDAIVELCKEIEEELKQSRKE